MGTHIPYMPHIAYLSLIHILLLRSRKPHRTVFRLPIWKQKCKIAGNRNESNKEILYDPLISNIRNFVIELLGFSEYYQTVGEQRNLIPPKTKQRVDRPDMKN